MTQQTQSENKCNTRIIAKVNIRAKPRRVRSWCFTLNNYTRREIATINTLKIDNSINKFCFQEEKGENQIPHLQGVINWKNATSFRHVKRLLPRAHWEQCRSLTASLRYCSKTETRVGKIYYHNYRPDDTGITMTEVDIMEDIGRQWLLNSASIDL